MKRSHICSLAASAGLALMVMTSAWAEDKGATQSAANATLWFEAEDCSEPKDAWQKDRFSNDKWNLWSTDKDAEKKWSGGIVLQSPKVMADMASPEEGAPPLHTRLTGIPKGTYTIQLKVGRVLAVSLDGKTWRRYSGGPLAADVVIEGGTFELWVDDCYAMEDPESRGSAYYDAILLHPEVPLPSKPKINGWAKGRVREPMGRGVMALPTAEGVYVSWRLLQSDPPDVGFDVHRSIGSQDWVKLNSVPITQTTDFLDSAVTDGTKPVYLVRPVNAPPSPEGAAAVAPKVEGTPYVSFKLNGNSVRFQKVGIADLNGDGRYDYVIKQPHDNVDPYQTYWYRSPDTYKIEAYLADGTFLWRNDLGWAIERGIWYSPWIVYDLDGDGRAEVAAKVGEGDPREEDGKVMRGPEWLVVWSGITGQEIARVPWPEREGFPDYNYASRNQIAVAYLDGKTPCLLALRGTYNRMKADAWHLVSGKLERLWKYDNDGLSRRYWGQGAHFTNAADVDADGRDEVILGSVVLDDNGVPLWSTGRGHPDFVYVGDIEPRQPGLEICYGMETRQSIGGVCLVNAATGKLLWELKESTGHVHGKGMCADIDPLEPGIECYGCNAGEGKKPERRWMFAADGTLLGMPMEFDFGIRTAWWDGDLQKEIVRGRIYDYEGGSLESRIEGDVILIADVLGDWREEIITSVPGELRIYSTTIPAADRRVSLMQDPIYRLDVAMNAMGYTQEPMLSYCPEALSPGMNLTAAQKDEEGGAVRVVVTSPLSAGVTGHVSLSADQGIELKPDMFDVKLGPGERIERTVEVRATGGASRCLVKARLEFDGKRLQGQVPVRLTGGFLKTGLMAQAEDFISEEGGKVRIRDDKAGAMGKAISHWDENGHALSWRLTVPAGRYRLVIRYCTPKSASRSLKLDERGFGSLVFPVTGGFGSSHQDWEHLTATREGKPLILELEEGAHTLRLENLDGQGLNLDYLALVPEK